MYSFVSEWSMTRPADVRSFAGRNERSIMNIEKAYNEQLQAQAEIRGLQGQLLTSLRDGNDSKQAAMLRSQIEARLKQVLSLNKQIGTATSQARVRGKKLWELVMEQKVMELRISLMDEWLKAAAEHADGKPTTGTRTLARQLATLRELKLSMDADIAAAMRATTIVKQ